MNKVQKKTCLILRINDYKDNKSIVTGLSKNDGLITFAVSGFKKFKSRMHGKIQKLQLIDGLLYEKTNQYLSLSSIEANIAPPSITCLKEYQNQQKLCFIAEKFHDIQTSDLIINIFAQTYQLGLKNTLHIYLIKILHEQNLIETISALHRANYFYINDKGIINNKSGAHKISLNAYKTLKHISKQNISNAAKLKIDEKTYQEIETLFVLLLEIKLGISINFRHLNNVFDSI